MTQPSFPPVGKFRFQEYPPSREPLDEAFKIGMMSAQEYDAALCLHHGTLCADCGRKITPDTALNGRLFVAVRTLPNGSTWFEHACRTEVAWVEGTPVVVAMDLHCTDMEAQIRIRPAPAGDPDMPSEAPVEP